jgi:hypothetical protein
MIMQDPTPSNDTRIVIEKTTADRVCNEVVVKKSIMLDHLPTNFDVAFRRARETLMMEGNMAEKRAIRLSQEGVLDPVPSEGKDNVGLDNRVKNVHQDDDDQVLKEGAPLPPQQQKQSSDHPIWGAMAEMGLKGTTDRTGGEGKILGGEASR